MHSSWRNCLFAGVAGGLLLFVATGVHSNFDSIWPCSFLRLGRQGGRRLSLSSFNDPNTRSYKSSPASAVLEDDLPGHRQQTHQQTRPPNILFLLLDQWRYDWDGHHTETQTGPLPLQTPFLWEMGRSGTRFTQAYTPSPFCAPARACLASGMEYEQTGVLINRPNNWNPDHTTIYKLLRDVGGYHTMTCGKDDLYYNDFRFPHYQNYKMRNSPDIDLGFSDAIRQDGKVRVMKDPPAHNKKQLNEPYRDFLNSQVVQMMNGTQISARDAYIACMTGEGPEGGCDATSFPESIYPDDFVRDRAIDLLKRKPSDSKPFFMQVNFPGPHHPVVVTSSMARSVMDRLWPPPVNPQQVEFAPSGEAMTCQQQWKLSGKKHVRVDPAKMKLVHPQKEGRCNYGAEIEHIDRLMSSIVEQLKATGELANTVVVVAGDHGENLGDNGTSGKGIPWQASVSVPLLISGPGVPRDQVHEGPVTTLDLGGTFLDLAGVKPTAFARGMTTTSLLGPLRGHVSSGYDNWRLVVKEMPTSPDNDQLVTSYKLICCMNRACKGAPPSTPKFQKPWQLLLYDVIGDPIHEVSLADSRPDVVEQLKVLLPDGYCR